MPGCEHPRILLPLDFSHWAAQQSAWLWVPWMPQNAFRGSVQPTDPQKLSEAFNGLNKSPPPMLSSMRTGHGAKRTELSAPGIGLVVSERVAAFGALLGAWSPTSQSGVCVGAFRWPLFERMGAERPIQSDSNG